DRIQETLNRLDRAKTDDERDSIYVDVVLVALQKKDPRVEEFLNKIIDTDLRQRLRAYVDFQAAQAAVRDKDVTEILRLARAGNLTPLQGAWALTEANSAESFDLNDIFAKLAREDLQRAIDLARTFDGEAPRAAATLAIARSVLDKGEKKQERASTN